MRTFSELLKVLQDKTSSQKSLVDAQSELTAALKRDQKVAVSVFGHMVDVLLAQGRDDNDPKLQTQALLNLGYLTRCSVIRDFYQEPKRVDVVIGSLTELINETKSKKACHLGVWCISVHSHPRSIGSSPLFEPLVSALVGALEDKRAFHSVSLESESITALNKLLAVAQDEMIALAPMWLPPVYRKLLSDVSKVSTAAVRATSAALAAYRSSSSSSSSGDEIPEDISRELSRQLFEESGGPLSHEKVNELLNGEHAVTVCHAWGLYVQLLGQFLFKDDFINRFLKVPETTFVSEDVNVRIASFTAWRGLVAALTREQGTTIPKKKVRLLMTPIRTSLKNEKDPNQSMAALKAWTHVVCALKADVVQYFPTVVQTVCKLVFARREEDSLDLKRVALSFITKLIVAIGPEPSAPPPSALSMKATATCSLTDSESPAASAEPLSDGVAVPSKMKVNDRWLVDNSVFFFGLLCVVFKSSDQATFDALSKPMRDFWQTFVARFLAASEAIQQSDAAVLDSKQPPSSSVSQLFDFAACCVDKFKSVDAQEQVKMPRSLQLSIVQLIMEVLLEVPSSGILTSTTHAIDFEHNAPNGKVALKNYVPATFLTACWLQLGVPTNNSSSNSSNDTDTVLSSETDLETFLKFYERLVRVADVAPDTVSYYHSMAGLLRDSPVFDTTAALSGGGSANTQSSTLFLELWLTVARRLQDHYCNTTSPIPSSAFSSSSAGLRHQPLCDTLLLPLSYMVGLHSVPDGMPRCVELWKSLLSTYLRIDRLQDPAESNGCIDVFVRSFLADELIMDFLSSNKYSVGIIGVLVDVIGIATTLLDSTRPGLRLLTEVVSSLLSVSHRCLSSKPADALATKVAKNALSVATTLFQRISPGDVLPALTALSTDCVPEKDASVKGENAVPSVPPFARWLSVTNDTKAVRDSVVQAWSEFCSAVGRKYKGKFDAGVLCLLSPFLVAAMTSRSSSIQNKAIEFWNERFGQNNGDGMKCTRELETALAALANVPATDIRIPSWASSALDSLVGARHQHTIAREQSVALPDDPHAKKRSRDGAGSNGSSEESRKKARTSDSESDSASATMEVSSPTAKFASSYRRASGDSPHGKRIKAETLPASNGAATTAVRNAASAVHRRQLFRDDSVGYVTVNSPPPKKGKMPLTEKQKEQRGKKADNPVMYNGLDRSMSAVTDLAPLSQDVGGGGGGGNDTLMTDVDEDGVKMVGRIRLPADLRPDELAETMCALLEHRRFQDLETTQLLELQHQWSAAMADAFKR
eukprot:TRINITY_DN6941_c1_g1_i1.p1 TRINITY_DN6941_c1_g1~~TRINITY_DN6941_c1_g1_i1.p1  ORF type:complete len:1272 (+),score=329.30 TRINITY_DN6941_c1_g1_i1:197-4012(+)